MPGRPLDEASKELELKFGYKQELHRELGLWNSFSVAFAYVSPIVGLYTVFALEFHLAGPAWVWSIVLVAVGQTVVAICFSELGANWPIAGAVYQWTRRLSGPKYGLWSGWIYVWANIATLAALCYAAGGFLGEVFNLNTTSLSVALPLATAVLAIVVLVNAVSVRILKYCVTVGIVAELAATFLMGSILLAFFRKHSFSVLFHTAGAVSAGHSYFPVFIATLAYGGWVFYGFDAAAAVAEETTQPGRYVPRAMISAVVIVGLVDILAAVALVVAQPNLHGAVTGTVVDPVAAPVTAAFGSGVTKLFLVLVVMGFISCGIATQATGVRVFYSMARDRLLPRSSFWRRVSPVTGTPLASVFLMGVLSGLVFLYGKVLSTLVGFATGGIYLAYLAPIVPLIVWRIKKRWKAPSSFNLGKLATVIAIIAAAWLGFEFVNIAWPRTPSLPWYENWAVFFGTGVLLALAAMWIWAEHRSFPTDADLEAEAAKEIQEASVELGVEPRDWEELTES